MRTSSAGGTVVAATGPGAASQVAFIDSATGKVIRTVTPFEASFTAGVYVAAIDLNGDGVADAVVTPEGGGGPRVQVLDGATGRPLVDFFGIEDSAFRGGARAVFADVNHDGTPDLAVVAAVGGGPRVAIYDGKSVMAGAPKQLAADFFAFDSTLRSGLTLVRRGLQRRRLRRPGRHGQRRGRPGRGGVQRLRADRQPPDAPGQLHPGRRDRPPRRDDECARPRRRRAGWTWSCPAAAASAATWGRA